MLFLITTVDDFSGGRQLESWSRMKGSFCASDRRGAIMVGKIKLEDGQYLLGPNGQIIRRLFDSEVAGVHLGRFWI
jgi:hypothetical protein